MFTGIIAAIGRLERASVRGEGRELVVGDAGGVLDGARPGDSIAVDGCCLTIERLDGAARFVAFASRETLARTVFAACRAGAPVNLEAALRVGDRVGGHFVQGHVDGLGRVARRERLGEGWTLGVELPEELLAEVATKGAIALHGVSLTVARLAGAVAEVAIIPETWARTTLRHLAIGAAVHVETDVIAKHVVRALAAGRGRGEDGAAGDGASGAQGGVTMELLRRAGFAS